MTKGWNRPNSPCQRKEIECLIIRLLPCFCCLSSHAVGHTLDPFAYNGCDCGAFNHTLVLGKNFFFCRQLSQVTLLTDRLLDAEEDVGEPWIQS